MAYEIIVNYAFRLINLAVLVGLAAYIFKKNVKSKIEDAAAEQEAYLTGLKQQSSALQMRLEEQEHEKEALIQETSMLKQKMKLWNESHQRALTQKQEEQDHIARTILAKLKQQQAHLKTMTLIKETTHDAVERATDELSRRYATSGANNDYLAKLVTYLKENGNG